MDRFFDQLTGGSDRPHISALPDTVPRPFLIFCFVLACCIAVLPSLFDANPILMSPQPRGVVAKWNWPGHLKELLDGPNFDQALAAVRAELIARSNANGDWPA